ncbi:MAG: hypothetical protein MHMPM18_000261 [Marteilia pararefringens]
MSTALEFEASFLTTIGAISASLLSTLLFLDFSDMMHLLPGANDTAAIDDYIKFPNLPHLSFLKDLLTTFSYTPDNHFDLVLMHIYIGLIGFAAIFYALKFLASTSRACSTNLCTILSFFQIPIISRILNSDFLNSSAAFITLLDLSVNYYTKKIATDQFLLLLLIQVILIAYINKSDDFVVEKI